MNTRPLQTLARIGTSAILLLTQLEMAGCGKEPMRPTPAAQQLASRTEANAHVARMPIDDPPMGVTTPNFAPPTWHGGPRSLPTGPYITPQELLAHTDSMPCVQKAKDAFSSRGYIRRADLDSLTIRDKSSTVLLGYQKPGLDASQAEAYIFIVTRRVDQLVGAEIGDPDNPGVFHEGYVPITMWQTQVGGGLIVHTNQDSVVFVDTPEDPALMVSTTMSQLATAPTLDGTQIVLSGLPAIIDAGDWMTGFDLFQYRSPDSLKYYIAIEDSMRTASYYDSLREQDRMACRYAGLFLVGFAEALATTYIVAATTPLGPSVLRMAIMLGLVQGTGNDAAYWISTPNP